MEYVGGTSLNDLVKQRTQQQGGAYSPLPVEQAIAYMIEVLPRFLPAHERTAVLRLQTGQRHPGRREREAHRPRRCPPHRRRRVADLRHGRIPGTRGRRDGTTIASDIYTVGRTLAVLVFEFKGSTSEYVDSLPTPEHVPLFAEHDSLYRLLLRTTAKAAEDRFQSADELREQLLGVLREVTSRRRRLPLGAVDVLRDAGHCERQLGWAELPSLRVDTADPMASWLAGVTSDDPARLLELLDEAPEQSAAVRLARADAALRAVTRAGAGRERRAAAGGSVGLAGGLDDRRRGDGRRRRSRCVSAFNAVYGQVPGELAPKLALARACELADERDGDRAGTVCSRTDGAYLPRAQFGLARLAQADGRTTDALAALGRIRRSAGRTARHAATGIAARG